MGRALQIISGVVLAVGLSGSALVPQTTSQQQPSRQENTVESQVTLLERHRDERELIAQERMADAADNQAFWAALSTAFSILAVGVAFAALLITMKNGRRSLRAYVLVEPKGVHEGKHPRNPSPIMWVQNWGQTPAYDVSSSVGCRVCRWPVIEDLTESFDDLEQSPRDGVLAPTQITTLYAHFEVELSKQEFGEISDGDSCLLVFGRIEYRDVFGKRHTTLFCHYYRGDHLTEETARFHSSWNHAT